MSELMQIKQISNETEAKIKRKSAYGLPIRPSDSGMRPEDIKKAFYNAMIGANDSVLSEIKRVIDECNNVLNVINENNSHRFLEIETDIVEMKNQIEESYNNFISHGGSKTYSSFSAFPAIGEENLLYIDGQKNKTYIFDTNTLIYKCVGNDDIEIIDGGTNENE